MDKRDVAAVLLAPLLGATVTNEAGTLTLDANTVLLSVNAYGYQACDLDVFLNMFGAAIPDGATADTGGVYDALCACDPDGSMGWKGHFDRWKASGLIA